MKSKIKAFIFFVAAWVFLAFVFSGCEKILPKAAEENEVLDGKVEGLTLDEELLFGEGDEAFARVFTPSTGLGPVFVETSCISCHIGDGRGHPFSELKRFSYTDPSTGLIDFLEEYGGPQLQHRSVPGYTAESIPQEANGVTTLLAPPNTGLGFLEAVSDADLLALADPDDLDGDGISGVPNYITPPASFVPFSFNQANSAGQYIGRFGRKASAINLLLQSAGAYRQDMGITSPIEPDEPQGGIDLPHEPEIDTEELDAVVFYLQTLKAPIPRNQDDPNVVAGKALFSQINCSGCHTPKMVTSDFYISALSNVAFEPYSDLLLHDMGPELDDNYTEGTATTSEWRTPPLWGLGLSPDAQGGSYFLMHDGRATSLDAAIQLHGGEAERSRTAYNNLSEGDKDNLIAFLESL